MYQNKVNFPDAIPEEGGRVLLPAAADVQVDAAGPVRLTIGVNNLELKTPSVLQSSMLSGTLNKWLL